MRIRTVFLACFCAVAVPGAAASIWLSASSWSGWQRAEQAQAATRAVSTAQRAQTAVAVEVGGFASQLRSATPDIETSRLSAPRTDQALQDAISSATEGGFQVEAARIVQQRVLAIRERAMAEMAKPLAARDASMPNQTQEVRNQSVDAMRRLGAEAAERVFETSPTAALLVEIASGAMDFRDMIGRRSVPVTAWIGGLPVQPQTYAEMHQLTGRMEQSWAGMQRLIAALPGNAPLQTAVAAQKAIQAQSEPRWRQMVEVARDVLAGGAANWNTTVPEFRPWSLRSQADILALRDVALDEAITQTNTLSSRARLTFLLAGLLAVAVCGIAAAAIVLLLRRVVLPLQALTGSVTRIAQGELSIVVPGRERADELGEMAAAVETLRAGSAERQRMVAEQQEGQRQQIARAARVDGLLRDFEEETAGVLRAVASAATEMDATAAGMVDIAASGNNRAAAVAGASQQASGNVQTVAAAAEELSASIAEVARQVRDGAARAQQASQAAEHTDRTVRGLSEAAGRIGDVVQLITGIASQTNLLALNATIEAARAGESGKGFAVVAGEVKNLASQTAKATEEIGQQIAGMQAETARTVQAIGDIARMIRELNEATGLVAEAAGQQAEATREIGHAVAQAAAGTEEASRHAAGVSEDAERTGRAAAEVRGAAGELAQRAEGLRGRMDDFLGALRVA
ncbi:methyl-accepting chemotaxis protein [Roseomonas haemaphysalidis]|uniref:Methyl-accepting chemotaxis protein n=1 Tax=Roseomonas haemaphysalidis TaxID=2768162 RepID=A0ABS3KR45_9PROT|nr:methyl-accepting chemotaxis protein [Roseomonas haemaphysalidis]MBO1079920.1 methyl-accepting chemotaxis protein [Roseomonas haemaphysalidis]